MGIDCTGMGGSENVKAIPGHLYSKVAVVIAKRLLQWFEV